MNIDIFLNQILLESIEYLFKFLKFKMPMLKDLKLENLYTKRHNQKLCHHQWKKLL